MGVKEVLLAKLVLSYLTHKLLKDTGVLDTSKFKYNARLGIVFVVASAAAQRLLSNIRSHFGN